MFRIPITKTTSDFVTEKLRYKASPFMEKKAVGKRSIPLGWDGEVSSLASNRPRERLFAEHDLGWDGEVSRS